MRAKAIENKDEIKHDRKSTKPGKSSIAAKPTTGKKGRPPRNLNILGQPTLLSFIDMQSQKAQRGSRSDSNCDAHDAVSSPTLLGKKKTEAGKNTGDEVNTAE